MTRPEEGPRAFLASPRDSSRASFILSGISLTNLVRGRGRGRGRVRVRLRGRARVRVGGEG